MTATTPSRRTPPARPPAGRGSPARPGDVPTRRPGRRALTASAWALGLAAMLAVLHLSAEALPGPPWPLSVDGVEQWLDARGGLGAAFSLVRLAALAVAWYLVAMGALTVIARLVGSRSLARAALRLTPRLARSFVRSLLGAGLSITLIGSAATGLAHAAPATPANSAMPAPSSNPAAPPVTAPGPTGPGSGVGAHVVRTDLAPPHQPPETITVTPLDPGAPPTTLPPSPPPTPPAPTTSPTTGPPHTTPGTTTPVPATGASTTTGTTAGPTGSTGGDSPRPDGADDGAGAPDGDTDPGAAPIPVPLDEGGSGARVGSLVDGALASLPGSLGAVLDARPDSATGSSAADGADHRDGGGTTTAALPDGAPATWVIGPGDHLWHVAETTLRSTWHRAPTEAEVVPYWTALIEANRDRLVDPANPDLVLPGQRLHLPPPPPPG